MAASTGLLFGPLPASAVHLCIDMQSLFSPEGPWPVPWIAKVLPTVCEISARFAARTIFMRFIPPKTPDDTRGMWRRFYRHWRDVTRDRLDPALLGLMPPLQTFVPPAVVCDRSVYNAFFSPQLVAELARRETTTLVITGGETDVCVLATTLSAIDQGYRVVLVTDALCSSSDRGHDALVGMFTARFSQQVETVTAEELIRAW
jgi:nicotinamidase-related amidase